MKTSPLILLMATLLFTVSAWAASPRIGLVRVEKGKVTLDGRSISAPQLVEQGSALTLTDGATVRLQLLGSGGEVVLHGPRTVKLDRDTLSQQAKTVKRGSIASVPDLGNTTRGATATVRRVEVGAESAQAAPSPKRGFRILVPPKLSGQEWVFTVETDPLFFDPSAVRAADWGITELRFAETANRDDASLPVLRPENVYYEEKLTGEVSRVAVPKEKLQPGVRYLLSVDVLDGKTFDEIVSYQEPFRLLTEDEKAYLANVASHLSELSRKTGSVRPLLELAHTYFEWDQLERARHWFSQAQHHPNWARLEQPVRSKAETFQRQLDAIWDVSAPE